MSNPQSNNHVVTGTVNQKLQGVSSQTWHFHSLQLDIIHSYTAVVPVDFKQTFSRDTATAEPCQFQFSFSRYFLTILSKSLSCLRGSHGCVHGPVPQAACEISHREAPMKEAPFPHPTGEGICTYLILIALTPEDPISLETRAQIVACWVTMPTYILHMPHLADTPKIPTTVGVLKMKNVKTSDSVKHVSQRGSGWIPVVWRIGSLEGGKLLRKDVNDRLSSEKTLSLHYLTLDCQYQNNIQKIQIIHSYDDIYSKV